MQARAKFRARMTFLLFLVHVTFLKRQSCLKSGQTTLEKLVWRKASRLVRINAGISG